jgi:hypothetical protein
MSSTRKELMDAMKAFKTQYDKELSQYKATVGGDLGAAGEIIINVIFHSKESFLAARKAHFPPALFGEYKVFASNEIKDYGDIIL